MIFRTKLFLQSTRFFAPTGFSCPFGPAFQGSGYRLHCCQGNNRSAALPIRRRLLPSPTGKVVTVCLEPCLSSLFPSAKKKIVTVCPDTPADRPCKHKFRFNKEPFIMEIHAYIIEENNINCYFFLPSTLLLSKKMVTVCPGSKKVTVFPAFSTAALWILPKNRHSFPFPAPLLFSCF